MEAARDERVKAGEEESVMEITMDTSAMEYSVVEEQGRLPEALSKEEEKVYACLVQIRGNHIQWRYEVTSYLNSLIIRVKNTKKEGKICKIWESHTRSCGGI